MRFERLHLERYGAFEGVSFDFGGTDARLHIVHGPNEAGKSTVLSAIGDLLFGIPARMPYNFRHDYPRLRIGAEIVDRAGKRLAFKRRKANSGTLLTLAPTEAPLPDAVLAPFLGGVSREMFERMFGLDHARLREGGDRMLRSGGDLARGLFEAGSGLSGIGDVLRKLEAEIDAIGDLDRRAKSKPIWREVEAFSEATQSVRRDGLKHEEWRKAEQELDDARSERRRIDEALARLRRRRALLQRVRRVAPLLLEVDALAARLAGYGGLPALPPGFAEEWRRRDEELREARLAFERAKEALRELAGELDRAPEPGPIAGFADEIEALRENLGRYRQGMAEEPELARDIAASEALVAHHLRSLGLRADPAAVAEAVPPATLVAAVCELVRRGEAADAAARAAEAELRKARDARRLAEEALSAHPPAIDPAPAAALAEEAWRLGDPAVQAAKAERGLKTAERDLAEALQRLSPWTGGAEALAARAFPDAEAVRFHEDGLVQARERLAAAARAIEEKEDEIRRVEADLAGLTALGEVPSPAAVRAARDRRDRGWRVIRARHVEGREPAAEDHAAFEGTDDLASRYETAVRHADELVDRRESEARRVARFGVLTAQAARLHGQREAAVAEREQARRSLDDAEVRWRDLWAPSGLSPDPAPGMRAWLARKDEALRLLGATRRAREEVEEAVSAADRARVALRGAAEMLGQAADPQLPMPDLARLVRLRIDSARRIWLGRQTAARKLEDEEDRVREKLAVAEDARAEVAAWNAKWTEAMGRLTLPADAGRPEAEAALAAWDEIRQRLAGMGQTAQRLEGIRSSAGDFRGALSRLVQALGADGAGLDAARDPEGTVGALVSRLGTARESAAARARIVAGHSAAVTAAEDARRAFRAADDACGVLRSIHGLAPEADVLAIADEVEARRRCAAELEERRRALAGTSDGLGEPDVRREVAATAPDAAVAELAALEDQETRLVEAAQAAAQRDTTARHALDALAGRRGAAASAQQARNAAQAAAAHVERWLRLTAAKALVERALERYRAENQHPLVTRGGEVLAVMAGTGDNPMVRLDVAYRDGADPALVGVRRDGSECPVAGMSEGTRDQLFLSLRIASVEQHAAANEPVPFIADDLFVTSDEARTARGLAALAELGRSTQVILFTHHEHVIAAASALPTAAVQVHRLAMMSSSTTARALAS